MLTSRLQTPARLAVASKFRSNRSPAFIIAASNRRIGRARPAVFTLCAQADSLAGRAVEHELGAEDWFSSVCGEYPVQSEQLEVFEKFSATLKQAAIAFAAVAAANVVITFVQEGIPVSDPGALLLKITVGNFALWADSIVVAALTFYGAHSFQSVLEAKCKNKLPYIFQGISRLTIVLQQFGIAAAALGAIHMLDAARTLPSITRLAAFLFIAVSATRGLLLRLLVHHHPAARGGIIPEMIAAVSAGKESAVGLWERRAMRFVLGHFISFNIPDAEEGKKPMPQTEQQAKLDGSGASGSPESQGQAQAEQPGNEAKPDQQSGEEPPVYFFNRAELQLVRICIDAMHFAGFALGSQGIATALLGLACFGSGNYVRAFSMATNGSTKVFSSMLLFSASTAFDRTFVIPSCHVCNLVDGVGPGGLTDLFHKLTIFSWSVVASQGLQLAVPFLQGSPLRHLVASETLGPHVTQALLYAQNLLAGL